MPHFAGNDVTQDEILFCYEKTPEFYEDRVRYEFLTSCYSQYSLENGAMFRGLYFPPNTECIRNTDVNGYPTELEVKLSDGLTPQELSETKDTFDSELVTKPADTATLHILSRACPHCHCRLPGDFGLIPTVTVSLLGGRASGKTAFLIAMIQQLQRPTECQPPGIGGASAREPGVHGAANSGFSRRTAVSPCPTPNQRLFPLVFRYTNATGGQSKSCFVVIYDIAGEVIVDKDITAMGNHKGIREATIFLLVIDPNQFNNGGYYVAAQKGLREPLSPTGEQHDYYHENVESFIQQKLNTCAKITDNVRHVITVLTKMDYPLTTDFALFGENSKCVVKTSLGDKHSRAVNLDVLNRIDHELNMLYRYKLNNLNIKEQICNVFSDRQQSQSADEPSVGVSLLGVSAYTQRMEGGNLIYVNDSSAGRRQNTGSSSRS